MFIRASMLAWQCRGPREKHAEPRGLWQDVWSESRLWSKDRNFSLIGFGLTSFEISKYTSLSLTVIVACCLEGS